MQLTLEQIEEEAKKLSEDEREILIRRLQTGLKTELDEAEIERLWIEEAERRIQEIKNGTVECEDVDTAIAAIRAELNEKD